MNFVKCCLALNKIIIIIIIIIVIIIIISTWSYENRVRKHFVILSQLPLSNSFFTQLFACLLLLLFVVRFVVKDLCRRGFKKNFANFYLPAPPPPPPRFTPSLCYFLFAPTHNSLVNTSFLKSVHGLSWFRCRLAVYISFILTTLRNVSRRA